MQSLIIANWKMNFMLPQAIIYAHNLSTAHYTHKLIIAPPAIFGAYLQAEFPTLNFCLQDISSYDGEGAYTGEYSAKMAKSCGINYALVGHSERRKYFYENNLNITKKISNCFNNDITPIICIGEPWEVRQEGRHYSFIREELKQLISTDINRDIVIAKEIIVVYEPIWAVGSGITPAIAEIEEMLIFIRAELAVSPVAKNIYLLYGGSVNLENYQEILAISGNNGLLLGTAALNETALKTILYEQN